MPGCVESFIVERANSLKKFSGLYQNGYPLSCSCQAHQRNGVFAPGGNDNHRLVVMQRWVLRGRRVRGWGVYKGVGASLFCCVGRCLLFRLVQSQQLRRGWGFVRNAGVLRRAYKISVKGLLRVLATSATWLRPAALEQRWTPHRCDASHEIIFHSLLRARLQDIPYEKRTTTRRSPGCSPWPGASP